MKKIEISQRDKMLLLILIGCILVGLSYMYGFKYFMKQAENTKAEVDTLEQRYLVLEGYQRDLPNIQEETATAKVDIVALDTIFPYDLTQDKAVIFSKYIEEATSIDFSTFSMEKGQDVMPLGKITGVAKEELTKLTGTEYKLSPAGESEEAALKSLSMTFSYKGTYAQLKDTLRYLNQYPERVVLQNVSLAGGEDEKLTGTFTVKLYAIKSPNRIDDKQLSLDISVGVPAIIEKMSAGTTKYGTILAVTSDPEADFVLRVGPAFSDRASVEMGPVNGEDYKFITMNGNVAYNASIILSGNVENGYTATYNIANRTKTVVFNPGAVLKVVAIGETHKNETDYTAVNLSIVNETDLSLNQENFYTDDSANPRIKIKVTEGGSTYYIKGQ